MKNNLKAFIIVFAFTSIAVFAQQQQMTTDQLKNLKIKPVFTYDEILFSYNLLNSIEISGAEVDNFFAARNAFAVVIKAAQGKGKKATDTEVVEMDIQTAQIFINLMARAKITGAQAEMYKRIQTIITESANVAKSQAK